MPVSFRRLRITGFKSFAEPVNVEILPGLTGIVGPNGCGKSNVVEALRWAMGESNARQLRGGEMDDVIFAGTAARASRRQAEVALLLQETAGIAPPPFHEQGELEIIRRIERGSGSNYQINGQDARARDVQTLFADLASGARASAMVSQGRVGSLVNARPEDRRVVLEEAAGITGLHARRHEAELKLRSAEANLARADDLRAQLETQLAGLKRQARQAIRYRGISGTIREAEAELLSIQHARVERARAAARSALHDAGTAVAAATEAATQATAEATDAAADLPALRETEAASRTILERYRLAQEQRAAEEERAKVALGEAIRRLDTLRRDLAHADQLQRDANDARERLTKEDSALSQALDGHETRAQAAEQAATHTADIVRAAEAAANAAMEAAADANARAHAANQMLTQADQRFRRIDEQFRRLRDDFARMRAQQVDPEKLTTAAGQVEQADAALIQARSALETAEQARSATLADVARTREAQAAADSARAKLAAEAQALTEILAVKDGERWPPMVDALTVPAGMESALGAVLGEELTSALNPGAPRHWRALPPFDPAPALPAGATVLAEIVQGPPALARVLSQIGVVESDAVGTEGQTHLAPGQILVSREGAIWRWDGYTIRAGTPTAATVRLRQRNRLADLRDRLTLAQQTADAARQARTAAESASQAASLAEQQARALRRDGEQRLERARAALAALRNEAATVAARLAAAEGALTRAAVEHEDATGALERAKATAAELPDIAELRARVDRTRAELSAARARESTARSDRDSLAREHAGRMNRRRVIAAERDGWTERARDASERVTDLNARLTEAEAQQAALQAAPARAAAQRAEALDALQVAEAAHRRSADALQIAVDRSGDADRAVRAAEVRLAAAREAAVRAEGAVTQADHAWGTVAERILERLGVNPALPDPPADLAPDAEDKARKRLERLQREREEMGPVNLRAEIEAEEIEKRLAGLEAEKQELATAIARLRGSIGHLNREGRERLNAVFQEVDKNFQQLFGRMFGGGRAHLALVGSDDPLAAGLEIYAQPPGKKLSALSLLSGGEQALTALSLIFAVFKCNPAPVCVLDEVDAPLDDANVDRFCALLEDMVRETGTRFLVVTHHPLTMARMDRLYGVTMQERGVSRLLSVDLARAAAMIEPVARMAAE